MDNLRRKTAILSGRKNDIILFLVATSIAFWLGISAITAFVTFTLSSQWMKESLPIITIQVPDGDMTLPTQLPTDPKITRAQAVMQHLSILPPNTKIHRLNNDEVDKLLEPLLGNTEHDALPLPAIIRIKLPPNYIFPSQLDTELQKNIPGTLTERGTYWEKHLQILASNLLLYTRLTIIPTAAVASLIMIFCTYQAIPFYQPMIRKLHFLGVTDGYLLRTLSFHNGFIGFYSSVIGCLVATLPLFLFVQMTMTAFNQPTISGHISAFLWDIKNHYKLSLKNLSYFFLMIIGYVTFLYTISTAYFVRHYLRKLP